MTFTFSVSGESGGWLAWGADTDYELRANVAAQLARAGFSTSQLTVDVGDAIGDRVTRNRFPYRATVTASSSLITTPADARAAVTTAFRNASGGNEPTISIVSDGEPAQPAPWTYGGAIGDVVGGTVNAIGDRAGAGLRAATWPLAVVAIGLVAVAVIVVKE